MNSDPTFGSVFLANIYLSGTHMRIWVLPEDIPLLYFVLPPHPYYPKLVIVFHLFLTMGCVKYTRLFCTTTKTVTEIFNMSWSVVPSTRPHPLDIMANIQPSPTNDTASACPAHDLDRELRILCCNLPTGDTSSILKYVYRSSAIR